MFRWSSSGLLFVLLSAVMASSATAQGSKSAANWANLNGVAQGSEIRVTLADGRTLRGFLQSVTADAVSINATTSQESLARPDVRRVAVKKPGHRGRNTLIGLAIGAGAGLAAGSGVDAKGATGGDWLPNAGKFVLTPVGAILGTVIGVAMPTGGWRDVYRVAGK